MSALHSPVIPVPWRQVRAATRAIQTTRIEFHFTPRYVQAVWERTRHPKAKTGTRGDSFPSEPEALLLDDVIQVDATTIFVRAWLLRSTKSDGYHLRVEIGAPEGVKRNLRIHLHWDNALYTANLRAGQMFFEDITTPDFSRRRNNLPSRRLRLSVEIEHAGSNGKDGKH